MIAFISLLPKSKIRQVEGSQMEEASKTLFEMQQRIASKLTAVGANSIEKAVTAIEADLDVPEQNWLGYIAGGLFARVKKTQDKRYYVATYY
jgi:hypothetical protein